MIKDTELNGSKPNIVIRVIEHIKWWYKREQKRCFGSKNRDKTVYIIRHGNDKIGLCGAIAVVMEHVDYAVKNGWYPVVDWKNYKNQYLGKNELHKKNAWDLYFEEPRGISLSDAYKSCNVILSRLWRMDEEYNDPFISDEKYKKLSVLNSKYIRINKESSEYVRKTWNSLFSPEDRVLGVLCRGTDYTALRPHMHPVQPEIEDVIIKAKEVMQEYSCNKIFLATEDSGIYDRLVGEFGDIVVTNSHKMYGQTGNMVLADIEDDRPDGARLRGLEYLTTISILSQCNCMIGGATNGTWYAKVLNGGKYEYNYIWNLGLYENPEVVL